jgi:ABC-type branched-subunit amino acid transport system substrate-binding protein
LKTIRRNIWQLLPALLLVACQPAGASSPGSSPNTPQPNATFTPLPTRQGAPDLAGESLRFYLLCDRSGPLAETSAYQIQAAQDMVAFLNEQGGIFGAEIDLQVADTAGDAEAAGRAYARLKRLDADLRLVLICDPLTQFALTENLEEDNIPTILFGAQLPADSSSFAIDLPAEQHFALWLDYLAENWEEVKPTGVTEGIRIAVFNGPPERGGVAGTPAALALAESLGIQIVLEASLDDQPGFNVYEPVYAARDANANLIYTSAPPAVSAELLNALNFLGLRERFLVAGPLAAFDAPFMAGLSDPAFAEGLVLSSPVAWWGSEGSALDQATAVFAQSRRPEEDRQGGYLRVLAGIDIARRVMEDAILANGFTGLDAAGVQAVLKDLEDYALFGGLASIDFSTGQRGPSHLLIIQLGVEPGQALWLQEFTGVPELPEPSEVE